MGARDFSEGWLATQARRPAWVARGETFVRICGWTEGPDAIWCDQSIWAVDRFGGMRGYCGPVIEPSPPESESTDWVAREVERITQAVAP